MKIKQILMLLGILAVLSGCGERGQIESIGTEQEIVEESSFSQEVVTEEITEVHTTAIHESAGLDFSMEGDTYVAWGFEGLDITTVTKKGNHGANLSSGGYVCDSEAGVFYATEEGIIWETDAGTEVLYGEKTSYINYYEGKLYFINENNRKVLEMTLEDKDMHVILENTGVYFLCVTEYGLYFVNNKNQLCLLDDDNNIAVIDDKAPGWMDFYGEWLVFAESGNNSCVVAVNCLTNEKKQLLSRAMYLCISEDKLYYSGCINSDESYIGELNLATGENRILSKYWNGSKVVLNGMLYFVSSDNIYGLNLENPAEAEEIYNTNQMYDYLSVSQGKLYFLSGKKMMYLDEGTAYEYEME